MMALYAQTASENCGSSFFFYLGCCLRWRERGKCSKRIVISSSTQNLLTRRQNSCIFNLS